jgi:transcriptional regulator with XRE-family HTH domain
MEGKDEMLARREMIGALVTKARQSAGLTLETCAHVLEVEPAQIEAYEAGESDLTLPQLEILSRLLGVPVIYFWSDNAADSIEQSLLSTSVLLEIRRRMIGVQIRQARLASGKSLGECAEQLGATTDDLAAYEYGRADIPFQALEVLAAFLHVPLSFFADEDRLSGTEQDQQLLEMIDQLPDDVRDFVLKPTNILYVRLAMLLSDLSTDTLRQIGEGLLDITL